MRSLSLPSSKVTFIELATSLHRDLVVQYMSMIAIGNRMMCGDVVFIHKCRVGLYLVKATLRRTFDSPATSLQVGQQWGADQNSQKMRLYPYHRRSANGQDVEISQIRFSVNPLQVEVTISVNNIGGTVQQKLTCTHGQPSSSYDTFKVVAVRCIRANAPTIERSW